MTRETERDDPLSAEIEAVLLPGAPSDEEKTEWVREALGRAEEALPAAEATAAPLDLLGAAAAALILILVGITFGPRIGWYDAHPVPEVTSDPPHPREEYEAARRANETAWRSPVIQARLAEAPKGSWAAIAAGRLITIEDTLAAVMAALRKTEWTTPPYHMFVFRAGTEGDVTYETTWPYEMVVGNAFLADTDLSFSMGQNGSAYWKGDQPPPKEQWTRFPSPDGRPFLPLVFSHPSGSEEDFQMPATFLVATGYGGPLILPGSPTLLLLEMPGLATVKDMTGGSRVFRRYLTRVRNESIGLDAVVEALSDCRTPVPPVEIGGQTWTRAGQTWTHRAPDPLEVSHRMVKPLAVLALDVSRGISTAPLEAEGVREKLGRCVRLLHVTPWTAPEGLDGAPFAAPAELIVYRPVGIGKDREMLLAGRVRVTEDSAGRIEEILERALANTRPSRLVFAVEGPRDPRTDQNLTAVLTNRFAGTGVDVGWLLGANPNPIRVDIPGSCRLGVDEVVRLTTMPGRLAFRMLARDGDPTASGALNLAKEKAAREEFPETYRTPESPDPDFPGFHWIRHREDESDGSPRWVLTRLDRWNFEGSTLDRLEVQPGPRGTDWVVSFRIDLKRRNDFGNFAGAVGRQLAIILDDRILSAPVLREPLVDRGIIEGGFDRSQAEILAIILRSGSFSSRLTLVERR